MSYLALKHIHVTLAALSISGFALRGLAMMAGAQVLQARWVRVTPHVVDAALLATGVSLAVASRTSPLAAPWLGAKLLAILVYIVLGAIALRRGRTPRVRRFALFGALATAAYVVAVAIGRDPVPV